MKALQYLASVMEQMVPEISQESSGNMQKYMTVFL